MKCQIYTFTRTHTHICIVIHRRTVSFYQNSSVWLDTQDARSWDRSPSNFTLDCDSDHLSTTRTTFAMGILRYFLFLARAAAAFVYIFHTLSATRVLNSFEELCITLAAAGNSFARELNPYGGAYMYIYAHTHTHTHTHTYIYIYIYICIYIVYLGWKSLFKLVLLKTMEYFRLERFHLKTLERKYSADFNNTQTHTHTHIYVYIIISGTVGRLCFMVDQPF